MSRKTLLESLKELENLSSIDANDPEDEGFETGKLSNFKETFDGEVKGSSKFCDLRKAAADNEAIVEKKYAGKKNSRKRLMEWVDNESADDDEDIHDGEIDSAALLDNYMDREGIIADDRNHGTQKKLGIEKNNDAETNQELGDLLEDNSDNEVENMNGDEAEDINDDETEDINDDETEDINDDETEDINDDETEDINDDETEDINDDEIEDINDDEESDEGIEFTKLPEDLQSNNFEDGLSHSPFTSIAPKDDLQKGKCTQTQLQILDKLLESRIRLQKSLQICNQLPLPDMMANFKQDAGSQITASYETARASLRGLLGKLLSLNEDLCDSNTETSSILKKGFRTVDPDEEEIPSDTEDEEENDEDTTNNSATEDVNVSYLPNKRKHPSSVEEYGEELSKRKKAFEPFYESTIKKWHEKTRLASNMINKKNFTAFDKSALQQIKQVLMDKERLIKRTQLSRVPLHILGTTKKSEEEKNDDTNLHLKNYNENIFDDGDFYHEMLKELIERKSNIDADDPVASSRRWLELQKLRSKIKRKVDTRASKGRKVRYDIHTKLVNFMAPENVGTMGDEAKNNLFASLFGQRAKVLCN